MTPEENKAILEEFLSYARDREKIHLTSQFLTPDFKRHDVFNLFPLRTGPGGVNEHMSEIFKAFPDFHAEVTDLFAAEGDRVVMSYIGHGTFTGELFGIKGTGKPVSWHAINIYRLENGKVAETWQHMDGLAILRGIGAIQDRT
ncbi:MAG TPA: ester cyclase [Polyangiaceae bacterium]|nr:ester cyclase [Polyangiaceae bacterium]